MTFWMNRLRKKNIENIAAGSSIMATKLAARVRLAKIRNGSSGCSTRDSTRKNSTSRTTPADQAGDRQAVAPAVRRVAGAGEAVDQGEQAAGAGDGAGDVELAAVALGLVEEARGEQGRDEADRHVDQEGQAPAVLRVEHVRCSARSASHPGSGRRPHRRPTSRRTPRRRGCAPVRPGRWS